MCDKLGQRLSVIMATAFIWAMLIRVSNCDSGLGEEMGPDLLTEDMHHEMGEAAVALAQAIEFVGVVAYVGL